MRKLWIAALTFVLLPLLNSCGGDDPEPVPQPEEPDTENPVSPSLTVANAKYKIHQISVNTEGGASITTKTDYVPCTVAIDSEYDEWDYSGTAGIRGRGNSTWSWYPKKPYRIKLDKKSPLLGMGTGKSWVLLANYRDPTHLMNSYVFALGQLLNMPYTNSIRYVELTLNGKYNGLYQFTEQVQQGSGRVNIDEKTGYLISLDSDDGPQLSPTATDNFWSQVYSMPVCVKNPDNPSSATLSAVKSDLATLETAIKNHNYTTVKSLINITTFIDFLIIQELVYNVELDAPRSMYMHKDVGGKWAMGPLWDFDGGYDFDWSTMYTGHTYFTSTRELVMGTQPYSHTGTSYNVPKFFTDLFRVKEFVTDYKARWAVVKPLALEAWTETLKYADYDAMKQNAETWQIDKSYSTEINRMGEWLKNRISYIDTVINAYPPGT
jgi:hypothetical protein